MPHHCARRWTACNSTPPAAVAHRFLHGTAIAHAHHRDVSAPAAPWCTYRSPATPTSGTSNGSPTTPGSKPLLVDDATAARDGCIQVDPAAPGHGVTISTRAPPFQGHDRRRRCRTSRRDRGTETPRRTRHGRRVRRTRARLACFTSRGPGDPYVGVDRTGRHSMNRRRRKGTGRVWETKSETPANEPAGKVKRPPEQPPATEAWKPKARVIRPPRTSNRPVRTRKTPSRRRWTDRTRRPRHARVLNAPDKAVVSRPLIV